MLQKGHRPGSSHNESAHVGNVKESGFFSRSQMFFQNTGWILDRHLPAGKRGHCGTQGFVLIVENGSLKCAHLLSSGVGNLGIAFLGSKLVADLKRDSQSEVNVFCSFLLDDTCDISIRDQQKKVKNRRQNKKFQMQGAQILRSEAYFAVRRSNEGCRGTPQMEFFVLPSSV
jgi:hypothetical protein